MTYTARMTNNRRDVFNMDPKRLLLNITDCNGNEFRDHAWCKETDAMLVVTPNKSNKPVWISFEAETIDYLRRGSTGALTLCKITCVKRCRRK